MSVYISMHTWMVFVLNPYWETLWSPGYRWW